MLGWLGTHSLAHLTGLALDAGLACILIGSVVGNMELVLDMHVDLAVRVVVV